MNANQFCERKAVLVLKDDFHWLTLGSSNYEANEPIDQLTLADNFGA